MIATIFSAADPGAARGALEAADELGLTVGGWTAANGLPDAYVYRLRSTLAPRMAARLNVQDSDGTLIMSFTPALAAGSPAAYADEAVEYQRKPSLHIVLPEGGRSAIPEDVRKGVLAWIAEEKIATLHVTGPREADEPGIQAAVRDALVWIFEEDEAGPHATFDGVDRAAVVEALPRAEACAAEGAQKGHSLEWVSGPLRSTEQILDENGPLGSYTLCLYWKPASPDDDRVYWVDFELFEVIGLPHPEGKPAEYQRRGSHSSPDLVRDLDAAESAAQGFVKWDGCTQFEISAVHVDSKRQLDRLLAAIGEARRRCALAMGGNYDKPSEYRGCAPALAAVVAAKRTIDEVNAFVAGVGPEFYLHRLDVCRCGLRRGDHDGATGCAFTLVKAHDPRAKSLEVPASSEPGADEA